jgi:hypothetical protein
MADRPFVRLRPACLDEDCRLSPTRVKMNCPRARTQAKPSLLPPRRRACIRGQDVMKADSRLDKPRTLCHNPLVLVVRQHSG